MARTQRRLQARHFAQLVVSLGITTVVTLLIVSPKSQQLIKQGLQDKLVAASPGADQKTSSAGNPARDEAGREL
ncbi:MAG: hypothetical protein ACWA5X_04850 [bacterium]